MSGESVPEIPVEEPPPDEPTLTPPSDEEMPAEEPTPTLPPAEGQPTGQPAFISPPATEPSLVTEVAPVPAAYNHTLLWVAGIFALLVVLLCVIAGLLVTSGAIDRLGNLASAILTPQPTETAGVSLISPTPASPAATVEITESWPRLYRADFQPRSNGLSSGWKVLSQAGSAVLDDRGLVVNGKLEAVVDGASWSNYRLAFKNLSFEKTTGFGVYIRYQDAQNYLKMACAPDAGNADQQVCNWYLTVNGETSLIPGSKEITTSGAGIDLEIVAQDEQIQGSIDQTTKRVFSDGHFKQGSAGFGVDSGTGEFTASSFSVTGLPVNDIPGATLFNDSFAEWPAGASDDKYASITRTLDGAYHIQATAKQGYFDWYTIPEGTALPDQFRLAVKARLVSGPDSTAYGLIFRAQKDDSFYRFIVADNGAYRVDLFTNDKLNDVIDWTDTSAILPNQANTLEVWGDGNTYYVSVNGQRLDTFTATDLSEGSFGVEYSIYNAGDKAEVEFSDLQVWAP